MKLITSMLKKSVFPQPANISGLLAIVLLMGMLEATGWSQCAMCRTALENSADGQAIGVGLNRGILFMLAAPYAILASIAYGIARAFRRNSHRS